MYVMEREALLSLTEWTHRVDAKWVGPPKNTTDVGVQGEQRVGLEGFISVDGIKKKRKFTK